MPTPIYASGSARIVMPKELGGYHIGMAIVVDTNHLVTCCHVINDAMNAALSVKRERLDRARPSEDLYFDVRFPYAFGVEAKGSVKVWGLEDSRSADVAVLELVEAAPKTIGVAQFSVAEVRGQAWSVIGWDAQEHSRDVQGTLGSIRHDGGMQLNGANGVATRIKPGYSGAAVWVDAVNAYVGMVTTTDTDFHINAVSYAVGARALVAHWPWLHLRETTTELTSDFNEAKARVADLQAMLRDSQVYERDKQKIYIFLGELATEEAELVLRSALGEQLSPLVREGVLRGLQLLETRRRREHLTGGD